MALSADREILDAGRLPACFDAPLKPARVRGCTCCWRSRSGGSRFAQPPAAHPSRRRGERRASAGRSCRLPGAQLDLETRSNMLATGTLEALRRCERPIVRLAPADRDRPARTAREAPDAELLFDLPEGATLSWTRFRARPAAIHVRVRGALTAERATASRFRNAEIELDLRGRLPDADELAQFRARSRARSIRIAADAPPEFMPGLEALRRRLTVETAQNQLPPAAKASRNRAADRIEFRRPFTPTSPAAGRDSKLSLP